MEVLLASIPLLTVIAIYDRWLYMRTVRVANEHTVTES